MFVPIVRLFCGARVIQEVYVVYGGRSSVVRTSEFNSADPGFDALVRQGVRDSFLSL